ncbi:MAG TPA: hypothetical protein DCE27_08560, partial [Xanthomarina gelatinilytica]|nr:hypothetical protein [Xanthomarina gelatinilytica]
MFLSLLTIVISCSNDNDFDNSNTQSTNYFVTINDVKNIVQSNRLKNSKSVFDSINIEIDTIYEVPDKNDLTAYYIINFKEKGFFILSADKRIEPFLAYSVENSLYLDSEAYPSGLV